MAWQLIVFVMFIYATIGVMELTKGNVAMSIVWFGYSMSNIGLAWLSYKG
jgi:hypothetical protein